MTEKEKEEQQEVGHDSLSDGFLSVFSTRMPFLREKQQKNYARAPNTERNRKAHAHLPSVTFQSVSLLRILCTYLSSRSAIILAPLASPPLILQVVPRLRNDYRRQCYQTCLVRLEISLRLKKVQEEEGRQRMKQVLLSMHPSCPEYSGCSSLLGGQVEVSLFC